MRVIAFEILGAHPAAPDAHGSQGQEWFDAIDLILELDGGQHVVLGIRTAGYIGARIDGRDPAWSNGYVPLPITLDIAAVDYWDFDQVRWLGPAPHECLLWSNAEALSERGLHFLFGDDRPQRFLLGPNGRGLPAPEAVGVTDRTVTRQVMPVASAPVAR